MARIALTFDDGPAPWTEAILDTLAEHGACATFFVIGSTAQNEPRLLRRIVDEGHELGNHTWSHPRLARDCDDDRVRDELVLTNALLTRTVGITPSRFRAPRYNVDERVLAVAAGLGLRHTHGDITPPDWDPRCTAPFITAFVLQQARPDAIVGLHDGVPPDTSGTRKRQDETVAAVARIVPGLVGREFQCVTTSELLDPGGGE